MLQSCFGMGPRFALSMVLCLASTLVHAQAAGWLADPKSGCRVWAGRIGAGAGFTWTGSCVEGFASGQGTVVYATTEPAEALLLGGFTAVLDGGELLQYGPTAEVFHRPASLRVARAFSDPPIDTVPKACRAGSRDCQGQQNLRREFQPRPRGSDS